MTPVCTTLFLLVGSTCALVCFGQSALPSSGDLHQAGLNSKLAGEVEADLTAHSYGRAEDKLLTVIRTSAEPGELLKALASIYFADAKYLQTAIAYKKAEKYVVLSEAARFQLAMSYVEIKQHSWAREELTNLRNTNPAQPLYSYWLGRLDYDAQKFGDAETNFKKALESEPHFVRAVDGLGLCEEATGDLTAAERYYRTAATFNREQGSHLAWPALDFGAMLSKVSRFSEAEPLLREAIAIDSKLAKAYYELGRVEEQTAREKAAISDFQAAAALDPREPSFPYALARVYRRTGKKDLAETAMARFRVLKGEH